MEGSAVTTDDTLVTTPAEPILIKLNRKARLRGKRQPKGAPFRRIQHNVIGIVDGPRFKRAWYHPTKGVRSQILSMKEAIVTLGRGGFAAAIPNTELNATEDAGRRLRAA